jgi:hypothetical protein
MSVEDFASFSQHDIARAEIEAWRGECLDLAAQSEAMVGALLELALERGFEVVLDSRASQRTLEAIRLIEMIAGSDEEKKDAVAALELWQGVESRGELLSHGMVTEALCRKGHWYAVIDMVTYRAGKPQKGRWVVARDDTDEFQQQLARAHRKLKLQLGLARLRLDD